MDRVIGIIGYGNMGSVIGQRLKPKYQIWVFDKDRGKTKNQVAADSAVDLVNRADTVILSVKPQDFDTLLAEIKNYIDEKLIVSIAAGISTAYIEHFLGKTRVVRVMPNLPARVGEGMSVLCKGKYGSEADLEFTRGLFNNLGETMLIEEDLMDAATAVSGSGPGYFYDLIEGMPEKELAKFVEEKFIPELSKAAEAVKFRAEQALKLAQATAAGAIVLLERGKSSPEALRSQVASKGGTTEAGLKELKHDIRFLEKAVKAALKRAKELSRK